MANNNGAAFKVLLGIIASAILTAILGLSGWTLKEVVSLKVQFAVFEEKLENHMDKVDEPVAVLRGR